MARRRCDICGDPELDGDPVVEYSDDRYAHIECAIDEGWEE